MIWPIAGRGRPRRRHVPDILIDSGPKTCWPTLHGRTSAGAPVRREIKAQFCRHPVLRIAAIRDAPSADESGTGKGQQHLPGEEAWLIGEHRMSGEKKYYLANLPAKTDLRTLAATIKARWICEAGSPTAERRTRSRSLRGTILARPSPSCAHDDDRICLPPASPPFNSKAGKKKSNGPPPQPTLPAVRHAILELIARPPPQRCPHCRKWICNEQRAVKCNLPK